METPFYAIVVACTIWVFLIEILAKITTKEKVRLFLLITQLILLILSYGGHKYLDPYLHMNSSAVFLVMIWTSILLRP